MNSNFVPSLNFKFLSLKGRFPEPAIVTNEQNLPRQIIRLHRFLILQPASFSNCRSTHRFPTLFPDPADRRGEPHLSSRQGGHPRRRSTGELPGGAAAAAGGARGVTVVVPPRRLAVHRRHDVLVPSHLFSQIHLLTINTLMSVTTSI